MIAADSNRSIPQYDSYEPLQISKTGLIQLLELLNVSPEFLIALYATGRPPLEAEEGFGQPIHHQDNDGSFGECSRLLTATSVLTISLLSADVSGTIL